MTCFTVFRFAGSCFQDFGESVSSNWKVLSGPEDTAAEEGPFCAGEAAAAAGRPAAAAPVGRLPAPPGPGPGRDLERGPLPAAAAGPPRLPPARSFCRSPGMSQIAVQSAIPSFQAWHC